jgi:DDE superfamily endonuclease
LPALSLDGILHLEVLDHSFTSEEFTNFVLGVLGQMQPWPLPNSVLVMDNASIHKDPHIREMVEEQYVVAYLQLINTDSLIRCL